MNPETCCSRALRVKACVSYTNPGATCVDTGLHLLRLHGVSGAGDEQRSVLNVPLGLTHLSVRMIPGLISSSDWI